jgi:hypothetical protein
MTGKDQSQAQNLNSSTETHKKFDWGPVTPIFAKQK